METEVTGWTKADHQRLLAAMKDNIPNNKKMNSYISGLKSLDWNKVAFPPFSPEACKQTWTTMQENMRKIRTLTELIVEAEDAIANPGCKRKGEECTEDEEDPPPKPPQTGYMLFCKEHLRSETGVSARKQLKVCAQRWHDLSDSEKEKYRTNCTELNRQYMTELNGYLERFDIEQQQQILREKGIKAPKKHKGEECTEDTEGLPPKPPQTGYMMFCKEHLRSETGASGKNNLEVCAQHWHDLSDSEKEKYRTNCTELNRQYRTKLNAYVERFDIEQQQRILRNRGIKAPKKHKGEECIEDAEDPPAKPPQSGYMLFCKEQLISMTSASKKLDVCAQRWHDLSESEKEKYRINCTELNRQYMTKLNAYVERFDVEQQQRILRNRGIKAPKKHKGEECIEDAEGLPPKPPQGGYNMFCKEQLTSMTGISKRNDFKVCAQRWRKLSKTEKEEYYTNCRELNRQYMTKLKAYVERFDIEKQQRILRERGIKTSKKQDKLMERLPGEPKRPPLCGNAIFFQNQMKLLKEKIPNPSQRLVTANKMWQDLSTKQKEHYKRQVDENMEEFRMELQKWFKTLTAAEQENYLTRNPKDHQYLKPKKREDFVNKPRLCQPSDSEDDDIEFSEEESCHYEEDDDEEEEDEEDAMFEM